MHEGEHDPNPEPFQALKVHEGEHEHDKQKLWRRHLRLRDFLCQLKGSRVLTIPGIPLNPGIRKFSGQFSFVTSLYICNVPVHNIYKNMLCDNKAFLESRYKTYTFWATYYTPLPVPAFNETLGVFSSLWQTYYTPGPNPSLWWHLPRSLQFSLTVILHTRPQSLPLMKPF